MIRTAITYNHRKRYGKNGTAPVEVRISVDKKYFYINTGVSVRAREWKFGQVINRNDESELNERIAIMLARVDRIVNERLKAGVGGIDIEEVRKAVKSPDKRKRVEDEEDMAAWMYDQIPMLGVAVGTARHYKVSVAAMVESGTMRRWSDLTLENVHKFDAWLHGIQKHRTDAEVKSGLPVQYISQATVRNYHKDIKALLGRAQKFGLITTNPYDRMKGEIKRGDKETVEFLTEDELGRIESLTLRDGSMLAAARDMFVFQAYTGMAYSDMQCFSLGDCRRDGDRWVLAKRRVKTGVVYYVQLLPQALAVAERYGGSLPRVDVQVYNRNLKKIADATGIAKRVTSHVARHTFATRMLHNGASIERVSKMLGHARITQTQRYAKVLAEDVYSEFEKIVKGRLP